jgi:hypothetical protein
MPFRPEQRHITNHYQYNRTAQNACLYSFLVNKEVG